MSGQYKIVISLPSGLGFELSVSDGDDAETLILGIAEELDEGHGFDEVIESLTRQMMEEKESSDKPWFPGGRHEGFSGTN